MDKKQKIFKNYEIADPIRIEKISRFIQNYFKEINGLNILECGVTKGGICDRLVGRGVNCWGVDINQRNLGNIKFIQADLNKGIPEFGASFDIIFAGEVIEHLYNDRKFIDECRKNLKTGGILIITVPNLVSLPNRFFMLFGSMPPVAYAGAEFHYHVYTRDKLKKMIKESGLDVLKTTSSYIFSGTAGARVIRKFLAILGDIFPTMGNQLIIFAKNSFD